MYYKVSVWTGLVWFVAQPSVAQLAVSEDRLFNRLNIESQEKLK